MSWQFLKKRIQIIPLSIDTNYCKVYNPFLKSLRGCFLSQVSCFLWIFELSHCCVLQNMWWINKQRDVCIVIHILLPLQRFILLVNYNNRTFFFLFAIIVIIYKKLDELCVSIVYIRWNKNGWRAQTKQFHFFFCCFVCSFSVFKKEKKGKRVRKVHVKFPRKNTKY
jgi:hypothetical protein